MAFETSFFFPKWIELATDLWTWMLHQGHSLEASLPHSTEQARMHPLAYRDQTGVARGH